MTKEKKFDTKRLLKLAGNIITVIVFVFIIRKLMSFDIDYRVYFSLEKLPWILLFVVIGLLSLFLNQLSWKIMLEHISQKKLPFTKSFRIYIKSNLGKYLPGNVMQYAARNVLGREFGISQTSIAMSSVLEVISVIVTTLILSIILGSKYIFKVLSTFVDNYSTELLVILFLFLIMLGLLILYLIYKKFPKFFSELKGMMTIKGIVTLFKSIFIISLSFLLNIIILVYVVGFSTKITVSLLINISIGFIMSWFVGFISIGSPGGIGVREAVLSMFMAPIIGESAILSASLFQRFLMILTDVLAYLLSKISITESILNYIDRNN